MIIQGALISLNGDILAQSYTLESLSSRTDLELGELKEKWLPIVIERETERECKDVIAWIESLDGVLCVDAVFSSIDGQVDAEAEKISIPH
ncbi:MAG: hypothetical protein MI748_08395 [Opitutales bacterium]|nr:hypothetical protein [Opitutales bacterium]